ncbi:MAG TPA: EamA family transporter [Pyrinomonadaceae bacterium]|nr:EamA family transporter [Pyrinomonadaceae bacterium]
MKNFYLPLALATGGSLLYHLSQRSIPKGMNPFFATIIAYVIGILLCSLCMLAFPAGKSLKDSVRELNWAVIVVGFAVVAIEVGFLLAYRAGWKISLAAVTTNVAVTALLIPLGILVFKEHLTPKNILGLIFCVLGLILVTRN